MRIRSLRSWLFALGITCAVAAMIGLVGWVYAGPASATASRGCAAANYPGGIANHPGGNCHVTATTVKSTPTTVKPKPTTTTAAPKPKPVTATTAKPKPKPVVSAAAKSTTQQQAAQQSLTTVAQIQTDDGVPASSTPQIVLGVLAVVLIGGVTYRVMGVRSR